MKLKQFITTLTLMFGVIMSTFAQTDSANYNLDQPPVYEQKDYVLMAILAGSTLVAAIVHRWLKKTGRVKKLSHEAPKEEKTS